MKQGDFLHHFGWDYSVRQGLRMFARLFSPIKYTKFALLYRFRQSVFRPLLVFRSGRPIATAFRMPISICRGRKTNTKTSLKNDSDEKSQIFLHGKGMAYQSYIQCLRFAALVMSHDNFLTVRTCILINLKALTSER